VDDLRLYLRTFAPPRIGSVRARERRARAAAGVTPLPSLRSSAAAVLPPWVLARGLVAGAWIVVRLAIDALDHGGTLQHDQGLFAWDGAFYRLIATEGYEHDAALRFFPAYPLLGRALGVVMVGREDIALVVIANALAFVAALLFHRLALLEGCDVRTATRAAWLLALFPASFVLVWAYSEPVLLVASIGCFLAMRQRRWLPAAALGLLAATSRPIGVLLVVPLVIEAWRAWRDERPRGRLLAALAVVAPAVGVSVFLLWSHTARGDAWLPLSEQQALRGDAVDPFSRLLDGVGELFGDDALTDGLHVLVALGLIVLLALCARLLPMSYTAYSAVLLAVALAAENLNSIERYALGAFPLVLSLAIVSRREVSERVVLIGSGGLLVALTCLAWFGAYVP
jgi:Mannosyltransferase (PIG-V)